jgi:hypothetical protein
VWQQQNKTLRTKTIVTIIYMYFFFAFREHKGPRHDLFIWFGLTTITQKWLVIKNMEIEDYCSFVLLFILIKKYRFITHLLCWWSSDPFVSLCVREFQDVWLVSFHYLQIILSFFVISYLFKCVIFLTFNIFWWSLTFEWYIEFYLYVYVVYGLI